MGILLFDTTNREFLIKVISIIVHHIKQSGNNSFQFVCGSPEAESESAT